MDARKVCVVTGSSSGIGAATVRLYARRGWNVVVNFSREAAPAEAVAAECRAFGAEAIVVRADVASDADCRAFAAEVERRFGRADVLVNNAGTSRYVAAKDLAGLAADDFQRIYSVNVVGAFHMVRAFEPLLASNEGAAIVNVSSIAALMGVGSSLPRSRSGSRARWHRRSASTRSPRAWSRRPGCRSSSARSATRRRSRAIAHAPRSTR
jgi:NAD(P)-dependent dehydrogenase (short-subunit alcohol dehydrogenase family)